MPAKKPPTGTDADLNLARRIPLYADEEQARKKFAKKAGKT